MNELSCPACNNPNARIPNEKTGDFDVFEDELCGRYEISGSALQSLRNCAAYIDAEGKREKLISLVQEKSHSGEMILTHDLEERHLIPIANARWNEKDPA